MRTHMLSTLKRARTLRKRMSLPEVLLWRALKERPNGFKFRRQHPHGSFVADFYCDQAKLIVEVDGIGHDMGDQPEFDARRDAWFRDQGLNVIRIPAAVVLDNIGEAVGAIIAAASPLHHAPHGPPPPMGED